MPQAPDIKTLGDLKASGWNSRSIKDELRDNLIQRLRKGQDSFPGILGYGQTVLPELEDAILARHNILLLGLRGQAKTRLARSLVTLLDPWMPALAGTELNDDPLNPISRAGKDLVAELGDSAPVVWIPAEARYIEKLATPDVSVADLIGDLDPIKAAALKLPYSDERVIHFGLAPRAHRGIFVINELPDLQARIQVALFNMLQEKDLQIRGFQLRLPVDVQFVFTANPEDYTNRGAIVTPLKDRIESQILTHYPPDMETGMAITLQETRLHPSQTIQPAALLDRLIERVAIEARSSEFVDSKSGVSARLTISARELAFAAAERRALLTGEKQARLRLADLYATLPAITGKVELVYEGEQEGPRKVAQLLLAKAIRAEFLALFPNPETLKRSKKLNPYEALVNWFNTGKNVDLMQNAPEAEYSRALNQVPGLKDLVRSLAQPADSSEEQLLMELVLHGLAECSQLGKKTIGPGFQFGDLLGNMLGGNLKFGANDDDDEEAPPRKRR